jgi:hypothetical protein
MQIARDVAAFVNVFGVKDPDLVVTLATIPWASEDDRNGFINELVEMNNGSLFYDVEDGES